MNFQQDSKISAEQRIPRSYPENKFVQKHDLRFDANHNEKSLPIPAERRQLSVGVVVSIKLWLEFANENAANEVVSGEMVPGGRSWLNNVTGSAEGCPLSNHGGWWGYCAMI